VTAEGLRIRPLVADDATELLELRRRNVTFLEPWEPLRDELFYTLPGQEVAVGAAVREREEGRAYPFVVVHAGAIVGAVNLNGVVRGVFQNAFLSRALAAKLARRGWGVLTHRKLPPNDGGLSAGQAAIAAAVSEGRRSACV